MFRFGIVSRIILALLLIGLLAAGGYWVYRVGWAQGYQAAAISAAQAAGSAASPAAPNAAAPYGAAPWAYGPWGYRHHMWGPGFGFFPLFGIGFFILFMLLIGGLFRGMAYRRWGGPPPPGPWSHYWRQEHEHEHGSAPEEKKE